MSTDNGKRLNLRAAPQVLDTSLSGFKAMLAGGDYLVLDTETTGLKRGEIIQIAMADAAGKVLLNTLVRPIEAIPADATRIHGIAAPDVANSPFWREIQPFVLELIKGRHVVIYNAVYDRNMMHQSDERNGMERTDYHAYAAFWCCMNMFAEIYAEPGFYGDWKWQRLDKAAAYYNVPAENAHTAIGDVLTTLAVCRAIVAAENATSGRVERNPGDA